MAGLHDTRSGMLACTLWEHDGATCLSVDGEVDLASVGAFGDHLNGAAGGGKNIVLDLKNLRYIDSTGINELLRARRRLARTGQHLVLADVSPRIRRILDIIAVDEVIPVFPTVDAALAGLHDGTKPG